MGQATTKIKSDENFCAPVTGSQPGTLLLSNIIISKTVAKIIEETCLRSKSWSAATPIATHCDIIEGWSENGIIYLEKCHVSIK